MTLATTSLRSVRSPFGCTWGGLIMGWFEHGMVCAEWCMLQWPRRSNSLRSRSKVVYFVAGLKVDILTKFHRNWPYAHRDGIDHVLLGGLGRRSRPLKNHSTMKIGKVWGCHEFYENIRIFMKLAWILWILHKVYEDGKSMRTSWILWKCQDFYEAGPPGWPGNI